MSFNDNRRERRMPLSILLNKYIDGEPHVCRAVNLSRGGMLLYKVFEPAMHLRPHKVHGTHLAIEWLLSNRIMGEGLPFFEMGRASTISRNSMTRARPFGSLA